MIYAKSGYNYSNDSGEDFWMTPSQFCIFVITLPPLWRRPYPLFEQTWIHSPKNNLYKFDWLWIAGSGEKYFKQDVFVKHKCTQETNSIDSHVYVKVFEK
jgi:hypothetical protein